MPLFAYNHKSGDAIRFTRNDRDAGRINGGRGEVIAVDAQTRTAMIQTSDGKTDTDLDAARDRHIAHAYVDTAFDAQGGTRNPFTWAYPAPRKRPPSSPMIAVS